jgi:hypothetical protein
MKIYFTITSLTFPYTIKILFLNKYKFLTYLHFFDKIPTQSPIKDKKMKEERNVYIKIMYKKPLLVSYALENTIATLDG